MEDIERRKIEAEIQTLEAEKAKLEAEKHDIESRHQRETHSRFMEKVRFFTTIGSVVIPLVVIFVTYLSSVSNQREQAMIQQRQEAAQWDIKAAELIMASEDVLQARSRYKMLTKLYPERMKKFDTPEDFDPLRYGSSREREIRQRKDLFKIIVAHPESAEKIIKAWRVLFPADKWVQELSLDKIRMASDLNYPWSIMPGGSTSVKGPILPPPIKSNR